jgi:hypothetical protein
MVFGSKRSAANSRSWRQSEISTANGRPQSLPRRRRHTEVPGYYVEYPLFIPEPSTFGLAALNLLTLGFYARRWRKREPIDSQEN